MTDLKIAHLSDLHLDYHSGRKTNAQGVNVREADGYLAFARIVNEVIQEACDAVVIAGDIFHTPSPSVRAILFAQNQFRKLASAGIKVYALAGNHDVLDQADSLAASKILDDRERGLFSHVEPYVRHEIADGVHIHLVSHHLYSLQSSTMNQVKPVGDEINIFATHGSVIDPILQMKLHAEQSPREIVIPDFLLTDKNWSYTFLGHIHERGWVGSKDNKTDTSKKRIYYNGSTIRRGFSDKETPLGRGWTLWTIRPDGTFVASPRQIPQRPQVDFKRIDASDLTSGEITDIILENLKSTQVTEEFDPKVAPLLRQKILNISSAKYAALDWKAIHQNSRHALQWSIKQVSDAAADDETGERTVLSNEEILKSNDIVQVYDDWISNSKALESVDKDIRETVEEQARRFVKLGQEATIEAEGV